MRSTSTLIGQYSTARKLSDDEVREIRAALRLRRENHPKQLAARYGVSASLIYLIANGREYRTEKVASGAAP